MTPDSALAALADVARAANFPWDDAWLARLHTLATVVAAQQQQTNLVGDASPAGVAEHVIEALAIAAAAQQALGDLPSQVADIGAGAGLESLTLALVWPQARVVAVEPRTKRAQFIALAAASLGLTNLYVVQKTLHSAALGPFCDLAVARAVWPAAEWLPKGFEITRQSGVVGVHGKGPAPALRALLQPLGDVRALREVPGPRGNVVAMVAQKR